MRKDPNSQIGKGMAGFFVGLLLATAVIAGVLFFLNKNKTGFKNPTADNTPVQPEILTPSGAASMPALPETPVGEASASASDAVSASVPAEASSVAPVVVPRTPEHRPEKSKPAPAREKPANVTPEAILNSGSVEKAREEAAASAKKPASVRMTVQAGSFRDRESADAQRAKLAMLGIDTVTVKGSVGKAEVFRVRTAPMPADAARRTAATLKSNGIDTLLLPNP